MSIILQAEKLYKEYKTSSGAVNALNGVDLSIEKGLFYAIIGRSGSGKSTLLHVLSGLDRPTSGKVLIDGVDMFSFSDEKMAIFRRRSMGFVFQQFNLFPNMTILENIMLAPVKLGKMTKEEANTRAMELLKRIGLADKAGAYPAQLSGGEQQRAALAKILLLNPDILLTGDVLEDMAAWLLARPGAAMATPQLRYPDGKPVEFTFFRPQQYGADYAVKEWPSFNAMLEGYYAEKDRAERLRTKSKELHKAVHNMYERAVRKQAARQEELAASGKSEKLRLYGELLSANLYMAQKGMKSITVPNWYDEGKEVTIPLDLRFSPSQNAQNFFKNYKKKQTAARMLVDLLAEGEKEIAYLETVLYEVETAAGEAALNEIRAELKSQGYLKYYKQRDKRQKPADFLRFTSSDGFEILVGRNNAQNDKLTLHTARGKDLWFHVQKAPGSHVVVMSRGEDIPDTTRQEAAELAVIYSSAYKAGAGAKVAVDTTEVKNIWKANGAKPGMVLYEVYTTVYITPRDGLEEQLKQKK